MPVSSEKGPRLAAHDAAVEQRGRAFDYFKLLKVQNIYRLCVISRLKAERPDSVAILQYEHAISIKPSHNGS